MNTNLDFVKLLLYKSLMFKAMFNVFPISELFECYSSRDLFLWKLDHRLCSCCLSCRMICLLAKYTPTRDWIEGWIIQGNLFQETLAEVRGNGTD